ncbi:MAG: hypothetical protein A2Y15_03460 [Clostridiales bacterium GWF2_36_10]|nr:MAG: hypothetical protein A2Y15_03460 [Clostridiales bacterium GWF2_36_10]HAN20792.1 hypothetical protein [Clostridiales bacterium]
MIDEIDNEDDRTVITLSTIDVENDVSTAAFIVVIDFSEEVPEIHENMQFILGHFTNRDNALYKIRDNIYLRYNYNKIKNEHLSTSGTTGIDILDFSDLNNIKYIYDAPWDGTVVNLINENIPLYYSNGFYCVITRKADNYNSYYLTFISVSQYRKEPIKTLYEISLGNDYYYKYEIVEYLGDYYYIPVNYNTPQWLQF